MFSSIASFLFGSNTNCETNSETTDTAAAAATGVTRDKTPHFSDNLVDAGNLIEVTSLTPSVTGANQRGKNRHNNYRQQNKRKGTKSTSNVQAPNITPTPSDTSNRDLEDYDEDDWVIIEKEDKEEEEEEDFSTLYASVEKSVPVGRTAKPINANIAHSVAQQHRLPHISSHSLYSGPRPQKQRNYLQKTRNYTNNHTVKGLSVSTLSPSHIVNDGRNGSGQEETADGGITRSLYVAPTASLQIDDGLDAPNKMEESWFITPPPCFTSIAPIIMETSPYENLLIEHPSMSVYHSIKKSQGTSKHFNKLVIGSNDMAEKQKLNETSAIKNQQAVQTSSTASYRSDRQSAAHLKQELMTRNVQKIRTKKEREDICRSAIQRANKVRDVQFRNHTQRRSDRQHCNIYSKANNNRKTNCC